jgi:hypothetical protein
VRRRCVVAAHLHRFPNAVHCEDTGGHPVRLSPTVGSRRPRASAPGASRCAPVGRLTHGPLGSDVPTRAWSVAARSLAPTRSACMWPRHPDSRPRIGSDDGGTRCARIGGRAARGAESSPHAAVLLGLGGAAGLPTCVWRHPCVDVRAVLDDDHAAGGGVGSRSRRSRSRVRVSRPRCPMRQLGAGGAHGTTEPDGLCVALTPAALPTAGVVQQNDQAGTDEDSANDLAGGPDGGAGTSTPRCPRHVPSCSTGSPTSCCAEVGMGHPVRRGHDRTLLRPA